MSNSKPYPTKLSVGIKVTSVNSAHVRFRMYANMIPKEQDHEQATRASMGNELVSRVEEFGPLMSRLQPDVLLASDKDWGRIHEFGINDSIELRSGMMGILG